MVKYWVPSSEPEKCLYLSILLMCNTKIITMSTIYQEKNKHWAWLAVFEVFSEYYFTTHFVVRCWHKCWRLKKNVKQKQRSEKNLANKSPYCYCFKNNFYPFLLVSQIEPVQDSLFWNTGLLKSTCHLFMKKTLSSVALFYSVGIRFLTAKDLT